MHFAAIDLLQWLLFAAIPFWVGGICALLKVVAGYTLDRESWWGFPAWMGSFTLIAAVGIGGLVLGIDRFADRQDRYSTCVAHGNADDPLNACPAWTVRALQSERTGA